MKPVLSGLPLAALQELFQFQPQPLPPYRARQVFQWIARGISSFHAMTDLPVPLRQSLDEQFSLYSSSISARLDDPDGTVKLQITLQDQERIEAVLLTDGEDRRTACLSTQAGCPMGCIFCKTGSRGFSRNLTAGEIVEQFFHLFSFLENLEKKEKRIVIMGMGEPLLNLSELRNALAVLTAPEGLGLSKRRITVSTCGIIDGIRELADAGPAVRLAVSLTAADGELREQLMPVTKTNPLPALKKALQYYQQQQGHRITLEAVLLGGVNTREKDIPALADFARGLEVAVNLIPWNPAAGLVFQGKPLQKPSQEEFERFAKGLEQKGLTVTRRARKGLSIAGACGQLGGT